MGYGFLAFDPVAGKYPYDGAVRDSALHFMGAFPQNRPVNAGREPFQSFDRMYAAFGEAGEVRDRRYHE